MNSKHRIVAWSLSAASVALFALLPAAFADTNPGSNTEESESVTESFIDMPDNQNSILSSDNRMTEPQDQQMAGTAANQPEKKTDQYQAQTGEDTSSMTTEDSGMMPSRASNLDEATRKQAKMKLAPHAVVIQSSLKSALAQVKGLRSNLDLAQSQTPSKEFIQQFHSQVNEINVDMKNVRSHEKKLEAAAKKDFPQIAQSDDFRSVGDSIRDLDSMSSKWRSKTSSRSYWSNRDQAMNDLKNLENKLNEAIRMNKMVSADQFDARNIG